MPARFAPSAGLVVKGEKTMKKTNGYIIYRGPSELDGAPIVVIATGFAKGSTNTKTGGGLIQTWILRDDIDPMVAANTGADSSICGQCPHRGVVIDGKNVGRSCYVTLFQAPLNVYRTLHRGNYPVADDLTELFDGRGVRLGAYGDPAAVPLEVWQAVMSGAAFCTGYTHQWLTAPLGFAEYVMASCDSAAERAMAIAMGYRTFTVRAASDPLVEGEIACPASAEAGHRTTCDKCKACGGTASRARCNIAIIAHGAPSKVNAFITRIAA